MFNDLSARQIVNLQDLFSLSFESCPQSAFAWIYDLSNALGIMDPIIRSIIQDNSNYKSFLTWLKHCDLLSNYNQANNLTLPLYAQPKNESSPIL